MHLKTDKKSKFFIYILLIILLTSINNNNFYKKKIFNIDHVIINGFSEKKNEIIKDEISSIIGKNIFFINKDIFEKLLIRNDTKNLTIKKIYPNKLSINFIPAKPICIILFDNSKIILGDNGKQQDINKIGKKLPIVSGSKNISHIFEVIDLLRISKLDYDRIEKINFFKSGRFDIILDNKILLRYPIKYSETIINYSSKLLNDKKFYNSKVIDLRLENKIIKYE